MTAPRPRYGFCLVLALAIFAFWAVGGIATTAFEAWRLDAFAVFDVAPSFAVLLGLVRGCFWALFTPLILYVAARLPVRRPYRLRNALLLLPAAFVLALAREAVGTAGKQWMGGEPWNPGEILGAWLLRLDIDVAIILIMMALVNAIRLQRESAGRARRSAELEAEVARAELRQLRADLQPHFLFNSLHGIATLLHTDPSAADRMLMSLSTLLRRTLEIRAESHISLGEELAFAHDYLALASMRYGDQLRFRIDAQEELLTAAVPPLLLQPLVENAVLHGAMSDGRAATIDVRAFAEAGRLRLEVRDNGSGCDPASAWSTTSVGLPNTKARLSLLYGNAASLSLRKEVEEFVAGVTLPLRFP